MKKTFTKFLAALMLLAIFTPSFTAMGQTRAEGDTHEFSQTLSQLLNNNATISSINIPAQSYSVKKVTISYRYNKTITNAVTMKVEVDGTSWGTEYSTGTGSDYTTVDFEGTPATGAIVISFTNNTGSGTGHGTFYVDKIILTEGPGGSTPTTYTVTFDAGDGTFVGNTDFPYASNTVEAGTYELPSATPPTGYTFNKWNIGDATYDAGDEYEVTGDADFVASYTENTTPTPGSDLELTFDLTSNPGGWPTSASTTLAEYDYTLSGVDYTFALKNVYCNSGYLMLKSVAVMGLPAIDGYKLKKVVAHNSNGCSTSTQVGISSSATQASYIAGGEVQTWSTQGSTYTYNLTSTGENTMYYMYVTTKNAQLFSLNLTYEPVAASTVATPTFSPAGGTCTQTQNVSISCTTAGATIYYTTDGSTPDNTSTQYNGAITVSETTTIKAIAYVSNAASDVATATYEFPLSTMQAIYDRATQIGSTAQNVNVTFGNWVVSGVGVGTDNNAKTVYVTDNEGKGFIIFTASHGFAANDKLSGTVLETPLKLYSNAAEFTSLTSSASGLTVTHDGTITEITNMAIADLSGVNTGAVVSLNNLTYSSSDQTLSDGSNNKIKPYTTLFDYGNSTFVDGQIYNVKGVYLQFNNTKEILPRSAADIAAASSTPVIGSQDVNIAYNATSGEIAYTISNPVSGITLDANCSENWVNNIAVTDDKVIFTTTVNEGTTDRTATFTLTYTGAQNKTVTVTQGHYVADYATLPFSFDGGRADIENTDGLTQEGLDSDYGSSPKLKFNGTGDYVILKINARPGKLTFDILGNSFSGSTFKVQTSEDGINYTDLNAYTTLTSTAQSEEFNNLGENVRYIKWIYTEKSSGNVALGNIRLLAYATPTNPTVNVGILTHVTTIEMWYVDTDIVDLNDGDEVAAGTEVFVEPTAESGYTPTSITVVDANSDPVNVTENSGNWSFTMPNSSVTISATATAPITGDKYVKVTSTSDLTDGQYLIVYEEGSLAFNGSLTTLDATSNTIAVTISNNEIAATNATIASEFTINTTDGTIQSASGYYIGQTSDANGMAVSDETPYTNTISFSDGAADIISSGGAYMRYNSASNQARFRYFKSSSYTNQQAIQLYKKVETPTPATYTLDITGYEDDEATDGWYLIASPLTGETDPSDVTYLINTAGYDLYRFNPDADKEWENYNQEGNHYHFNMEAGRGYLYANIETLTLQFTGTLNTTSKVTLAYDGWNLIGNSSNAPKYYDGEYYIMNPAGSGLIVSERVGGYVNAMEGIFVEGEEGDEITFSTGTKRDNNSQVVLNIRNNDNVIDRAIVRFNSDRQLGKLTLFDGDTKIYIPQNDGDYAIVSSNGQGTMPVNFKAKEMGMYTISVETEGIDLSYLHLIDRLTGEDVNLLLDNKYSFIASNSDTESRFILSFNENGINANNDTFAFQNGSDIIVNGEGELQIFDVMGRMVKNTVIYGVEAIAMPQGVYIFKLNGNVQKIVVR